MAEWTAAGNEHFQPDAGVFTMAGRRLTNHLIWPRAGLNVLPIWQSLYRLLFQPVTQSEDSQRRELILNIMLAGLTLCTVVAWALSLFYRLFLENTPSSGVLDTTTVFGMGLALLWYLSRRGWYQIGSSVLIGLLWLSALDITIGYSVELPGAELAFALAVVVAGVLVNGRVGLLIATTTAAAITLLGRLQASGALHPNIAWLRQPVKTGDAAGYAVIMMIIGLVAWLANREIDKSLRRARISEAQLVQERDSLEEHVVERTKQLERSQLQRVLELQRFADFGRFSAGFLHDLANPVTAVSLNIQQLDRTANAEVLKDISSSLNQVERYIEAARKQLQHESELKQFNLQSELSQVMAIMETKAKQVGVSIELDCARRLSLYGDSVKFSQIAANLIANAIEACDGLSAPVSKPIVVSARRRKGGIELRVVDFGSGIDDEVLPHIFDSFYSTKVANNRGTGIGLSTVKQIVERDFHGTIDATGSPKTGTEFKVWLQGYER